MPNLDINISTTADTGGAVQAKTAVENLTHEVKTGTAEHESYREKQHQILEGMHMIALMTGGELREGFHETGLGMRLLGSLTGEMSLGIVGISAAAGMAIPLVVGAFKEMYNAGSEEAKKFAEDNKAAATKASEDLGALDEVARTKTLTIAQNARDVATAMVKLYTDVAEAENKAAVSASKNAVTNLSARTIILQALGLEVDKMKDIYTLARMHLETIEAEARMHSDALKGAADKTEEENQNIRMERVATADKRAALIEELARQREIRDTIYEQNEALEKAASVRSNKHPVADSLLTLITPSDPISAVGKVANNMTGWVEDTINQHTEDKSKEMREDSLTAARSRVASLEKELEKSDAEWDKSLTQLVTIERKNDASSEALKANLEEIEKSAAADANLEKAKVILESGKQNAVDINSVFGKITATTALESGAVGDIHQLAADQIIVTKELPKAIDDMRRMLGSYQAGFMLMSGNAPENIRQMTEVIKNLEDQAKFSESYSKQMDSVISSMRHLNTRATDHDTQLRNLWEAMSH